MRILLLLLLVSPVWAQLPQQPDDAIMLENEEFLLKEVRTIQSNRLKKSGGDITGELTIAGNVGIGTVSPRSKLEVDGNILQTTGDSLATDEVKAIDGDGLKVNDDGGNGIFVKDGGNVGIGTTSPGEKLEVSGGLKVTGAATSPPSADTLYKENIIKGWVNYDGTAVTAPVDMTGVDASFNVSAVEGVATGNQKVYWNKDFASADYVVVCTSSRPQAWIAAQTAGTAQIYTSDSGGVLANATIVNCVAIGN